MPDGDIKLTVTLDTAEVTKQLKSLKSEIANTFGGLNVSLFVSEVQKVSENLNRAVANLEKANSQGTQAFNNVANATKDAVAQTNKFNNSVGKRTTGMFDGIKKAASKAFSFQGISMGVKRLAQVTFGVYGVISAFRKLRSAAKEGLNNLVQFHSKTNETNKAMTSLQTSLLYLKNAWGAAFAPIINAVMPMITMLINGLATVGNYIARFVAALTGQKTVLQAVKVSAGDYAKGLKKSEKNAKGAAGAQKKLNDRLAQFDDLNVLGKDDKSSGGGSGAGGGGASGVDPNSMFKRVKVDKGEFQWILDLIDDIKKKIKDSGIIEAVENLWYALQNFINSDVGKAIGKAFGILLSKSFESALSVLSGVIQGIADIFNGDWVDAATHLFGAIADLTLDPLIILASIIDSFLGTDVAGWFTTFKDNLKELPGEVAEASTTIASNVSELFAYLRAYVENSEFADKVNDLVARVVLAWNNMVANIKETASLFFTQVLPSTVSLLGEMLSAKWADIKGRAINAWESLGFNVANTFRSAVQGIVEKATNLKVMLQTTWDNIRSTATEKLTALKNKFIEIFNGIREGLKAPINGIIGIVESLVNKIIKAINGIIDKLNALPSLQFKNPFNGQDYKLGFNIPRLSNVSIPRLAEGAVIPPNKEFMAVLGDQKSGTNIEAPLDTIKQAVAEVMGNNGSAEMIQLLQQLIAVVESKNLTIGDKEIGKANARYANQQRIIRGTSF